MSAIQRVEETIVSVASTFDAIIYAQSDGAGSAQHTAMAVVFNGGMESRYR